MSTPSVLDDTTRGAEQSGLRVALVAPGFDVDRYEDLRQLAAARHGNETLACPRTLSWLDVHGLWPDAPAARGAGGA